jgi:hypothetical protein
MQPQMIENQVRTYMYDLMNEAREHGFKEEDKWTLILVTENEQKRIRNNYYPAVANKVSPDILLQLFLAVKSGLHQPLSKEESAMDIKTILHDNLNYIVAYNPKRHR